MLLWSLPFRLSLLSGVGLLPGRVAQSKRYSDSRRLAQGQPVETRTRPELEGDYSSTCLSTEVFKADGTGPRERRLPPARRGHHPRAQLMVATIHAVLWHHGENDKDHS